MQYLSGLLAFTMARFLTQLQALPGPGVGVRLARFITSSELVNLSSSYAFLSLTINSKKHKFYVLPRKPNIFFLSSKYSFHL